jgi:hypothetical protein
MSDGFEVINDAADEEGSEAEGGSIARRRLFQMGAAGVAAVGTAAVANALTASPAGATPGSAVLVGADNTAGTALTQITGGNGFSVTSPAGAGGGTTIAVEGNTSGTATFGAIGVKGVGFAGVQGVSNGSNTLGTAGVQGIGASWNPGVVANNTGFPSLFLAPSGTALPHGGAGATPTKPVPGSFIVLNDGSLHYAAAAGQWQKVSGPPGFAQGVSCLLSKPIRILDTRPGHSGVPINPGAPIAGGTSFGLQVTGESVGGVQVPAGAVAVIGNVTVVNTTGAGFLTLYPAGTSVPNTSSINFTAANQVVANGVIIRLGPTGGMDIFASTTTDVLFDATGFIG